MKNGELYPSFQDECPVHGTAIKTEYEFGKYRDASVITFKGCGCAVCTRHDGFSNRPQYFTNYQQAAGAARLTQALASVF